MTPASANLFNAIILIAMSLWGYFEAVDPSPTALIPAGFGLVFLLLTPAMRKENKVVAHIVVVLTLLVLLALFMPLKGALDRGETMAVFRVGLMMLSSLLALIVFVRSFIQARRARA